MGKGVMRTISDQYCFERKSKMLILGQSSRSILKLITPPPHFGLSHFERYIWTQFVILTEKNDVLSATMKSILPVVVFLKLCGFVSCQFGQSETLTCSIDMPRNRLMFLGILYNELSIKSIIP